MACKFYLLAPFVNFNLLARHVNSNPFMPFAIFNLPASFANSNPLAPFTNFNPIARHGFVYAKRTLKFFRERGLLAKCCFVIPRTRLLRGYESASRAVRRKRWIDMGAARNSKLHVALV